MVPLWLRQAQPPLGGRSGDATLASTGSAAVNWSIGPRQPTRVERSKAESKPEAYKQSLPKVS